MELTKAPWVVHFFKNKPMVITYNNIPVGHIAHRQVLYTKDGCPHLFLEIHDPYVAIEEEKDIANDCWATSDK